MSSFSHVLDRNSEITDTTRNFVSYLMQVDVSTINKMHDVICDVLDARTDSTTVQYGSESVQGGI